MPNLQSVQDWLARQGGKPGDLVPRLARRLILPGMLLLGGLGVALAWGTGSAQVADFLLRRSATGMARGHTTDVYWLATPEARFGAGLPGSRVGRPQLHLHYTVVFRASDGHEVRTAFRLLLDPGPWWKQATAAAPIELSNIEVRFPSSYLDALLRQRAESWPRMYSTTPGSDAIGSEFQAFWIVLDDPLALQALAWRWAPTAEGFEVRYDPSDPRRFLTLADLESTNHTGHRILAGFFTLFGTGMALFLFIPALHLSTGSLHLGWRLAIFGAVLVLIPFWAPRFAAVSRWVARGSSITAVAGIFLDLARPEVLLGQPLREPDPTRGPFTALRYRIETSEYAEVLGLLDLDPNAASDRTFMSEDAAYSALVDQVTAHLLSLDAKSLHHVLSLQRKLLASDRPALGIAFLDAARAIAADPQRAQETRSLAGHLLYDTVRRVHYYPGELGEAARLQRLQALTAWSDPDIAQRAQRYVAKAAEHAERVRNR